MASNTFILELAQLHKHLNNTTSDDEECDIGPPFTIKWYRNTKQFPHNEKRLRRHTGFASWKQFKKEWNSIKDVWTQQMTRSHCYIDGQHLSQSGRRGRKPQLHMYDEFAIVFLRIYGGWEVDTIAERYQISDTHVSELFRAGLALVVKYWCPRYMYQLSPEQVQAHNSTLVNNVFKLKGVLLVPAVLCGDNMEIKIEKSSDLILQMTTTSAKLKFKFNTLKIFTFVCADGWIANCSTCFGGRTPEVDAVTLSNILDKHNFAITQEAFALIMDRGFRDLHFSHDLQKVEVYIPAFLHGRSQFTTEEVQSSHTISAIRAMVEQMNRSINESKLFSKVRNTFLDIMDDAVLVSCSISNMKLFYSK